MTELALLALATAAAGMLSAVTGFGGAVIVTPVFVAVLGVRDAVAVLTVVQLASNVSRVALNRHDVERSIVAGLQRRCGACRRRRLDCSSPSPLCRPWREPSGSSCCLRSCGCGWPHPSRISEGRHLLGSVQRPDSVRRSSAASALSWLRFFLARGLVRGAYIGTEAATAVVMHLVKLVVYGAVAVLTTTGLLYGLALAPASVAGSWMGRRVVERMPVEVFRAVVEVGLVVAGVLLILRG